MHLSPSQIDRFLKCAEQWRRIYYEKDREIPGIALIVGKTAHKTIETNNREKIETGVDMSTDDMKDHVADEYESTINNGVYIPREEAGDAAEQRRVLGKGKDKAVKSIEVYGAEVAPKIQPASVEMKVLADIGSDALLKGVIDCVDVDGSILEFKTGKKWTQARADSEIQPVAYTALFKYRYDSMPSSFVYHNLAASETKKDGLKIEAVELKTTRAQENIERLAETMQAIHHAIRAGNFPPAHPSMWWCSAKWCGFWDTCKVRLK